MVLSLPTTGTLTKSSPCDSPESASASLNYVTQADPSNTFCNAEFVTPSATTGSTFTATFALAHTAAAQVTDASRLVLDRNWTGGNTTVNLYQSPGRPLAGYAIGGYGQQPYMLGITINGLNWAANSGDTSSNCLSTPCNTAWQNLTFNAATWLWTSGNGYDPYSNGINYGANGYAGCDNNKAPISTTQGFILGTAEGNGDWCQVDSTLNGGINTARGVAAEAMGSLTQYYLSNPGPTLKTFGDTIYGSIWASAAYTTGGVYTAPDNLPGSNMFWASYKWPGFYCGMGFCHQWPAVRLGGVLPAVPTPEAFVCRAVFGGKCGTGKVIW